MAEPKTLPRPPAPHEEPYGIHDVAFDQAWIAAVDLGKVLAGHPGDRDRLVARVREALHPASVHGEQHDESRGLDLPDYATELLKACDLVGQDDDAASAALGRACWDLYQSHPLQFSLKHLKKVWKQRPE
jgi:hypothetical protein